MSYSEIKTYLFDVERCLMVKYGARRAELDLDPLVWYITTGRAPTSFLKALLEKKPYLVARRLHQGGSHQEVVYRLCKFLGVEKEQ